MRAEHFEDVIAWQKAKALTLRIYSLFKNHRDFDLRDQIQRASVTIMNNIAEGFERDGDKEKRRFFFMSKGSAGEVRSMLYIAKDLGVISDADFQYCRDTCIEISRILGAFIRHLS